MKVLTLFFVLEFSLTLVAQETKVNRARPYVPWVEVQPTAHFVRPNDPPLRWISQTITDEDQLKELVLQNISNDTIVGFQLGWAIFIPEGCGVNEAGVSRQETHRAPYETRTVAPGETVTVGPYHFSTKSITDLERHAHSPAVVAQIGIFRVRFAKGRETISPFEQLGAFGQEVSTFSCQTQGTVDGNVLETLRSDDGGFQFEYSQLLINCIEGKHQAGWWGDESCEAFIPICDDTDVDQVTTLSCIAYPRYYFDDAPTFEGAAFSVAKLRHPTSEGDCLRGSPDWVARSAKNGGDIETINGVSFKLFGLGGAATSHWLEGDVYRTFHGGNCYQLALRMAMASPDLFDADINEFTKQDWNEVHGRLQKALDSFQFLK